MKLYHHPFSQPSRTTRAVAMHLDIPLETEVVDLGQGAQRSPEYLARNPNGKVPCLQVGDEFLWESQAIQDYLVALAPSQELLPADGLARARVQRWRFWAETTWNRPLATLAWQRIFGPRFMGSETDAEAVEAAEASFRAAAAILEAQLGTSSWVEGETLTLADFALACMLTYWEFSGAPLAEFSALRSWYGRVGELECWQATTPDFSQMG